MTTPKQPAPVKCPVYKDTKQVWDMQNEQYVTCLVCSPKQPAPATCCPLAFVDEHGSIVIVGEEAFRKTSFVGVDRAFPDSWIRLMPVKQPASSDAPSHPDKCTICAHLEDGFCNAGIDCIGGSAFAPKPSPGDGQDAVQVSKLLSTSIELQNYLIDNSESIVDIPDTIWIPFSKAITDEMLIQQQPTAQAGILNIEPTTCRTVSRP
jgi:hypothetical protein